MCAKRFLLPLVLLFFSLSLFCQDTSSLDEIIARQRRIIFLSQQQSASWLLQENILRDERLSLLSEKESFAKEKADWNASKELPNQADSELKKLNDLLEKQLQSQSRCERISKIKTKAIFVLSTLSATLAITLAVN